MAHMQRRKKFLVCRMSTAMVTVAAGAGRGQVARGLRAEAA